MPVKTALGMMSGTSLDGVDAGILRTDGDVIAGFGETFYRAYSTGERSVIRNALAVAAEGNDYDPGLAVFAEATRIVTDAHQEAAKELIRRAPAETVEIIGFHGQTILHAPERGVTVQIGDGEDLANRLGIPVVFDFRAEDVAAGGEGAPFAPVYHRALARWMGIERPACYLNLGGVSNLTYIGADDAMLAFDAGPANALLDDWMSKRTGGTRDEDGRAGAAGIVDEARVAAFVRHEFFGLTVPKSLDRNTFAAALNDLSALSTEDGAATLTAMTAAGIASGLEQLPGRPSALIVVGGGAHNPTLCRMIAEACQVEVVRAGAVGLSEDFIEAQAFAYLAVRHLHGLPLSFPGTTGVARPMTGGRTAEPSREPA